MKSPKELVFLLGIVVFVPVLIVALPSPNKTGRHRNSKYMGFPPDDMLQDALDGVEDPLVGIAKQNGQDNRFNVTETTPSIIPKPSGVNDTSPITFSVKADDDDDDETTQHADETIQVAPSTTPAYHLHPIRPMTDNSAILYGGHRDPVTFHPHPPPNNTEEIKVFWNSVGDAVESVPFLPVQLNVPDMISAMTTFLVNYLPFLNRIGNANHPRPQKIIEVNHPGDHSEALTYYETIDYDQGSVDPIGRREYRVRPDGKTHKKKRKNKRKTAGDRINVRDLSKPTTATPTKKIFQFPNFRKTTEAPAEDTKLWNAVGSDQKETFKLKNMPITRKRIRVADREIFNFKNSDISNSPIMILNVPQRPITHYKIIHQETQSDEKTTPIKEQLLAQLGSQITERSLPKQKRKMKNVKKSKKQSKRTEKSLADERTGERERTTTTTTTSILS